MTTTNVSVPSERIISRIFLIRGKKVMFDKDIAELYGVETRLLNQTVKRNILRFPSDFMFRLNSAETKVWQSYLLRSQIVILKQGQHLKYTPCVFTEQGVAMLSSVLKSPRAIQVNIQIIRTFTQLREMLSGHKELRQKIEQIEQKYDKQLVTIFQILQRLLKTEDEPRETIGFKDRKNK